MKPKVKRLEGETRQDFDNRRSRIRKAYGKSVLNMYKIKKGCAQCGWNDHHAGLEFNHIIPRSKRTDKSFNLGSNAHYIAFGNGTKCRNNIKEELSKCEVLCRNCHGILTYEQQRWRNKTNVTR